MPPLSIVFFVAAFRFCSDLALLGDPFQHLVEGGLDALAPGAEMDRPWQLALRRSRDQCVSSE